MTWECFARALSCAHLAEHRAIGSNGAMDSTHQLSPDDIVLLAERESGAHGLVEQPLRDRVASLVGWINERGPYTAAQVDAMQRQIVQVLARRLRLALDRARFPAIAAEPIERPIFIIGFARSGTTLLHSLLAEDPEVLKPLSWHVYSPSPPPGAGPVVAERIAYAQRQVEAWMDFCPAQKPMHPYVDKGAMQLIEDEEIFTLDLRNAYPYHFYRVPTLHPSAVILGGEQADAFRFHREFLQHLQWNSGKTRWVCKGPSAQLHLDALFEVYPDALCVWPHRPLGEIYASNVALRAATYDTIQGKPVDWSSQAKAHVEGLWAAVERMIASDKIDDPRILHLPFREIASDPLAAVRKVCDAYGTEPTPEFERRARVWLDHPENAADRFGRYPYSYEPFGLDREWVEELFAPYSERFGL
jgi:hypothetical protein